MLSEDERTSYDELRYIKRRFIHKEALRAAIADVANAIFDIRQPEIWGDATVACASDSKKFGAWDQNLLTEWHIGRKRAIMKRSSGNTETARGCTARLGLADKYLIWYNHDR